MKSQLLDQSCIEGFRKRYSHLHPLVFHRSVERAKDALNLFEILDSVPDYPIVWDEKTRVWIRDTDITAQKQLSFKKK